MKEWDGEDAGWAEWNFKFKMGLFSHLVGVEKAWLQHEDRAADQILKRAEIFEQVLNSKLGGIS